MTKKELEQYRDLGREIKLYLGQKKETRRELAGYEQAASMVKGSMPQFPFTQRSIFVGGISANEDGQEAEIKELAQVIGHIKQRRREIREYILSIEDSELRQIFTLRYLYGKSWGQVGRKMGPGYTGDAARMKVERFYKKK